MKRYLWKRYRKFRLHRYAPHKAFWITLLILCGMVIWWDRGALSLVEQYANTAAQRYAVQTVHHKVNDVLETQALAYQDLITVRRDANGWVTSLEADTVEISKLKSAITAAVTAQLGEKQIVTVDIPLGTLLGSRWFGGRGPRIPFAVGVSGTTLTDVYSEFSDAGINQTAHRIILEVKTDVFIALPLANSTVNDHTKFIITENILLGNTPEAYTEVKNDGQDTTGQIFDFQSEIEN